MDEFYALLALREARGLIENQLLESQLQTPDPNHIGQKIILGGYMRGLKDAIELIDAKIDEYRRQAQR